ncbi:hypothetical protein C8R42DRAFT_716390 [Lentinula raphanica]|nr:hypothetical protein C8R42DRAFT_716390 [Lentinula raphanica]
MSRASPKFRGRVVVWPVLVLVLVLLLPIVRAMPTPPDHSGKSRQHSGNPDPELEKIVEVCYTLSYPEYPKDFKRPIKQVLRDENPGISDDELEFRYSLVSEGALKVEQEKIDNVRTQVDRMAMIYVADTQYFGLEKQLREGAVKCEVEVTHSADAVRKWYPSYELKPGDDVHVKQLVGDTERDWGPGGRKEGHGWKGGGVSGGALGKKQKLARPTRSSQEWVAV